MAPALSASNASFCYLDLDLGHHRAQLARTAAFVQATNTRYGFSSNDWRQLGGSELSRLPELMANDHEWSAGSTNRVVVKPPPQSGNRLIVQLDWETAPLACENFATLCSNGGGDRSWRSTTNCSQESKVPPAPMGDSGKPLTYRGSCIHRVVTSFIVQGGDFCLGNGSGGEAVVGSKGKFKDERAGLLKKHDQRGLLSMGNSGKNANTSQFFFTLGPAPQCNGKHVVFGKVTSGGDLLDAMEALAREDSSDETPREPILVTDCGIWTPFETPGAGYWLDQPDPESYSGVSPLFVVRPRVAIVAPNDAACQKFQAALGTHCVVTPIDASSAKETLSSLLRSQSVDVVLVAPACHEQRLEELPSEWSQKGLTVDQVILEAKPIDALSCLRQKSWLAGKKSWQMDGVTT